MHKEEERKTKQKRRVVNAAPEQENEITQKSGWRSCVGQGCGQGQDPALPGAGTGAGPARDSVRSGEGAVEPQAGLGTGK